ncbi:MAG: NAD(P)-dependent oxidoreductase [Lachnospiraceae bacterium]|nr:NAD(P)-dependent oxidoreductase [Lachnospiraceae bacterium]
MKVMISGATGAIGMALLREAVKLGYEVGCLVNPDSDRKSKIADFPGIRIYECSVDDYSHFNIQEKYDAFVHLAWKKTFGKARDDMDVQLDNVRYTLDAVRLADRLNCTYFIGAGSQAEYGVKNEPLSPEMLVAPESGYGIAKYTAGRMSSILCDQLNLKHSWIRILSVYGPDDGRNSLISYVISSLKSGEILRLTKCEQTWDYLYSEDCARAIMSVMESGCKSDYYVLGNGNGKKLYEYVEAIKNIINPHAEIEYGAIDYYPHQPMFLVADISRLVGDTGWKPAVDFEDGIRKIVFKEIAEYGRGKKNIFI